MAYAIRSAMDLGMHVRHKRPLPTDEHEARVLLVRQAFLVPAIHR